MTERAKPLPLSGMAFAGITCAMVASIRNVPDVAATGWTMFFYMLIAVLCYALPIALISGEYACMFPGSGGPELWVTNVFGKEWGFMTAWLLWAQMFPGVVMGSSILAPLLGETLGIPFLKTSKTAILVCLLAMYWLVIILNMKVDMVKLVGNIGVWFGLYIPAAMIIVFGSAALVKSGFKVDGLAAAESVLGLYKPAVLIPYAESGRSMVYASSILFIFAGIELSSVYIPRLRPPVKKSYIKGLLAALGFTFAFTVVCAFLFAALTPARSMALNDLGGPFGIFCELLGAPKIIPKVFCFFVFIGVIVQASAWAAGPARSITESARRGMYPKSWRFWKTNKHGVSDAVLFAQGLVVTVLSLVFILVPAVNEAFLLLVTAACVLFNMVYLIMLFGIIWLRVTKPELPRPFHIGGKNSRSNLPLYLVAGLLFCTIIVSLKATFSAGTVRGGIVVAVICALFLLIPLLILKHVHHGTAFPS